MPIPKAKLFTPAELANLRLGFYTQAPTMAALIYTTADFENMKTADLSRVIEASASFTVELIEALIDEIAEVER
jgi:hypothetical protein